MRNRGTSTSGMKGGDIYLMSNEAGGFESTQYWKPKINPSDMTTSFDSS